MRNKEEVEHHSMTAHMKQVKPMMVPAALQGQTKAKIHRDDKFEYCEMSVDVGQNLNDQTIKDNGYICYSQNTVGGIFTKKYRKPL